MKALFLALLLMSFISAEADSVHCNFGGVNHFSKFNDVRLAIMAADGISVRSDIPARYDSSHALVTGTVSYFVTIDAQGKILAIKINESSGDTTNDATALRLIRAVSPFKINPGYAGVLNIRFKKDDDLISVLPIESKNNSNIPANSPTK